MEHNESAIHNYCREKGQKAFLKINQNKFQSIILLITDFICLKFWNVWINNQDSTFILLRKVQTLLLQEFKSKHLTNNLELTPNSWHKTGFQDHKGNQLYLGINHLGILTFQGSRKTNHFRWSEVHKINYEGKMFIIHLIYQEVCAINNQRIVSVRFTRCTRYSSANGYANSARNENSCLLFITA